MATNCPYCGTPLQKTNLGRYFCPNCGLVGKDPDAYEPKGDDDSCLSYIG